MEKYEEEILVADMKTTLMRDGGLTEDEAEELMEDFGYDDEF